MENDTEKYEGINPEVEGDGRAHLKETLEADAEFRRVWEANRARRELAMFIMERRLELGLSQRELADRIGTSQNRVYLLENGEANPTLDTLHKLAEALDFTLEIKTADRATELVAG